MKYFSLFLIIFPSLLFSQNSIILGEFCSQNKKNCITFLKNNNFQQILNLDIGIVINGKYYYDNKFLILVENHEINQNLQPDEFFTKNETLTNFSVDSLKNKNFTLFKINFQ